MFKGKYKRLIYLILTIIWMINVFVLSNQNGCESQRTSNFITEIIVELLIKNQSISEEELLNLIEKMDYIVRKIAHFSIYLLGGILIYNYINTFELNLSPKTILSIIIGVGYAILDEFHQYFVDGRSAQILDVCIDSLGIIIGVILISIISKWGEVYYEHKGYRNRRNTCC